MCQVNEEDLEKVAGNGEEMPSVKTIKDLTGRTCVKCGEEPAVIHLRDEDFKCGKCLVASVQQKFRTVLAKFQISRTRDRILVAYSGGSDSSALLGAIRQSTTGSLHSKLFLVPVVIYVDEGALHYLSEETRQTNVTTVMELARSIEPTWMCLHTTLEMVFAHSTDDMLHEFTEGSPVALCSTNDSRDRLKKLMSSIKSQTGKEEIARLLRNSLLQRISHHLKITKLFVGDSVDRLAVHLITNTALGKGKRLPLDLGYVDQHDPTLTIVRPLKDVTKREITMYNSVVGIDCLANAAIQTSPAESADAITSVYSFTEKFIFDLQNGDFPQTATTLCRTGDKLCSSGVVGRADKRIQDETAICGFCSGPLDSSETDSCTAENSIALSIRLSTAPKNLTAVDLEDALLDRRNKNASCDSKEKDSSCGDSGSCCQSKSNDTRKTTENLCYTCRWLIGELSDRNLLPESIRSSDAKAVNRHKMRETIEEFLLEKDDD